MSASLLEFLRTWKTLKNENFLERQHILTDILLEKQLLASKDGHTTTVSSINQMLSANQTRLNGLVLLIQFVQHAQPDILKRYVISWIEQLTTVLQQYQPDGIYRLTCCTLSGLIAEAAHHPEQSHQLAISAVPSLLQALIQAPSSWRFEAARCLHACLRCFPGPGGPVKDKVMTFLVPLLTSGVEKSVEVALRCYCLLPSTGGTGHQGSKHTAAWNAEFNRLVASIDALLSMAYSELDEIEDKVVGGEDVTVLPWLCDDVEEGELEQIARRYALACRCAAAMMTSSVRFQRKIRVSVIVRTMTRCLSVNACVLEAKPITHRLMLARMISPLHKSTMDLLDALVKCSGTNMLTHSRIVSKMYKGTLYWTNGTSEAASRQYRKLRMRIYQSMITWFENAKHGLAVNDLLTEMTSDILPEHGDLKLESKMRSMGELMEKTKKGKGKKKKIGTAGGDHAKLSESEPNYDCVRPCLLAIQAMLRVSCHRLNVSNLHTIQNLVIRALLDWQSGQKTRPYDRPDCRGLLYALLRSFLLARHPKWMPATQVYIRIFSAATRVEKDDEILRLCAETLTMCSAFIHPRYPALYGLHTPPDEQKSESVEKPELSSFDIYLRGRSSDPSAADAVAGISSPTAVVQASVTGDESNNAQPPSPRAEEIADTVDPLAETGNESPPSTKVEESSGDEGVATTAAMETESQPESDGDSVDQLTHQIDDLVSDTKPELENEEKRPESPQPSCSRAYKRSASPCSEISPKIRAIGLSGSRSEAAEDSQTADGAEPEVKKNPEETEEDEEDVDNMLMTFVDAGPDSDSA